MVKRRTDKEMNIAIQNYRMVAKDWLKKNYSYSKAKKLIENHISGKRKDWLFGEFEPLMCDKIEGVKYYHKY